MLSRLPKLALLVIPVLLVALAFGPGATLIYAGAPPGAWVSGVACTNLSSTQIPASGLVLTFYPADNATAALTYTDPNALNGGASRNYFTPSLSGLPSPFAGSAVVSSPQPMACTVNTQRNDSGVGSQTVPARVETYSGVGSTGIGPTVYAPQVMKAFSSPAWNSYIAVQNTGSSAVTVNISYKNSSGNAVAAASESKSIPGQTGHIFYQSDNAGLPANFIGSATISGGTGSALAAVVNFYNAATSSSTAQFQSYNTFSAGAAKLYVPRFVRNYYGFNGGMSIQNVGGAATTVQIVFTFGTTQYTYNSPSIASGASLALYAPNISQLNPVDSLAVGQRVGSAVVTAAAGGSVIAIVNEDNRGTCNAAACPAIPANQVGWGSTYEAFNDGSQKNTATFPQVTSHVGSQDYSGGFQVANATGTATTCNITYSAAPAANQSNVALPANGSFSRYGPNIANMPSGYNASATVSCGQPIIGIGNLGARNPNYFGSTMSAVNGILQ